LVGGISWPEECSWGPSIWFEDSLELLRVRDGLFEGVFDVTSMRADNFSPRLSPTVTEPNVRSFGGSREECRFPASLYVLFLGIKGSGMVSKGVIGDLGVLVALLSVSKRLPFSVEPALVAEEVEKWASAVGRFGVLGFSS
jgi:hypothetical protein